MRNVFPSHNACLLQMCQNASLCEKSKRYFFYIDCEDVFTTYINHSLPFPSYHEYTADDFENIPENIWELPLNESTIIELG